MRRSFIAFKRLHGEEGSALMAAFWMLVVLLLVGMAATYTTTTEVGLSGNDRSEAQLFYLAEAGLAQCKRYLDGLGIPMQGDGTDLTSPVQVYLDEPIGIAGGGKWYFHCIHRSAGQAAGETDQVPRDYSPGQASRFSDGEGGAGDGGAGEFRQVRLLH